MEILCTLKNLNLTFGPKVLFSQTGLTINEGDKIGLLGLNGHGKSTFFKILTGEIKADSSTPPFAFDKAKDIGEEKQSFSVFRVPQEFQIFVKNETISDYIFHFYPTLKTVHAELTSLETKLSATHTNHDFLIKHQQSLLEHFDHLKGWEIIRSYESYLKFFGFNDLGINVGQLSGGEQKRVLLALGLSTPSPLVLWDEPTNHLDIETIRQLEDELAQSNKTFIIITHDRYLLSSITNKIVHIGHGDIKRFDGSYTDYLEHLKSEEHARIQLLGRLKNRLQREDDWMKQGIKARGTRSKKRVENFHDLKSKISIIKEQAKKELSLTIHNSDRKTKILAKLKNVSFAYNNNNKTLIKNFSMEITKGEKIGLLGGNGVGKSTLLSLIAKELSPASGNVDHADGLRIGIFTQKRSELDNNKTPFEILGNGQDQVNLPNGRSMHVIAYFEKFLFNRDEINRPLHTFSGGERNRLQMALNLSRSADLWIFDEPTNDLDLESLTILETHLAEFDGSLIIVSHDRAFLNNVTNKVWLLENSEIQKFEAGYSQVEAYLEVKSMEDEIADYNASSTQITVNPKDIDTANNPSKSQKLTNKEKERIKTLPAIIKLKEHELELIDQEIEAFDFGSVDIEARNSYIELSSKKEANESELLEMYQELEDINHKAIIYEK